MYILKPCPFCTCAAAEWETTTDGDGYVLCSQIECPACLARGPETHSEIAAARAWNERDPPLKREEVAVASAYGEKK
jgi:Lar family restriction alleviation protein